MDPELLRAFVSVAESRGFTAAARALNRTQSAVSLQIKRLEEQIGDSLFTRTSRSVELTGAGSALLPYARRILRLQDEAAAALGAAGQAPTLRVGLTEEQAQAYLPNVIPAFRARHPEVQLEVACDLSSRLVARIQNGDLDLALTIRNTQISTGDVVAREGLSWVAHTSFVQDPHKPLPVAFGPEGDIYRAFAMAGMARLQRACHLVFVSTSPTGINLAVNAGMAATVKAGRAVPETCRVLDDEAGMPALPPVDVELHRASTASTVGDTFVELLLAEIEASADVAVLPGARDVAGLES
jgi:DNA-binding transcriptional LysR family regulator